MKHYVSLILTLLITLSVSAQKGKITGKVTNTRNEPLAGVSIKITGGTTGFIRTDVEGRFTVTLETAKKYELTFSYVGYAEKTIDEVQPKLSGEEVLNVVMEEDKKTLGEVTVKSGTRGSAKGETVNALIQYQKNTSTVAQVISAEAIKRSPDKNTGEVLKRIPGTSVQDGKYLIVRGLSDRYNQAMLNGVLLSSTEPDRKTFSFDIFPASMLDNIIINKAFVPELPGEWAGGLVQVNTKDVPSSSFFNMQIGTGFNTQTIGHDFYNYKGGSLDWLGLDNGTRALPSSLPTKSQFNLLNQADKTAYGKQLQNVWTTQKNNSSLLPVLNTSLQVSGGFNKNIGKNNKLGAIAALTYNRGIKRTEFHNSFFSINDMQADVNFDYYNNKYSTDILWGALGNLTLQLGNNHKISFKNLININTSDYTTKRTGKDFENDPVHGENIRATEIGFRENTFYNGQLTGDHNFPKLKSKLHWYGSFNILDQYIPDQRRIQYNQNVSSGANTPYLLLISNTRSQKTGSRYYGMLNDYIYNAGGDVARTFNLFGLSQTVKTGYNFQVKDRLFDSRPFSIYLSTDNPTLRQLSEDQVFNPENFGNGTDNKFGFDEIYGTQFRYVANSILNAAFLQFDNQFSRKLRVVWGARWEEFDQVVGSMVKSDPRHVHTKVGDILPGINITYKLNNKTNIRLSGSQTVVRPEFREISNFAFFDFELGATVLGNNQLGRTKITNADLRYELYPRAGELFTVGVFYKYFKSPIELYFNQSGVGTSSTFNYLNAEKAIGYGAELEFRKKLDFAQAFKNFTVQANLSYIYNEVKDSKTNIKRPMQGQSPYLINASLQYDVEKLGLNTTILFNQIGRRILYVGNDQIPAIWEAPRPLLDLQIAKKVMKNKGEVKLNISDLINQPAYYYHDLDKNKKFVKGSADALAINKRFGTNISLSFAYNIK